VLRVMSQGAEEDRRQFSGAFRTVVILVLRVALVVALIGAGWLIYQQLPASASGTTQDIPTTNLQIVLHQPENGGPALDVQVSLYPVNVVAVRHEFFSEPRAGKRWDDFLKERMKGRSPVNVHLDKEGKGSTMLAPGSWWLHAKLKGEEEIEWRLPVTVIGPRQVVELTSQNAYTRSRVF
jgi:hypothetical protein